jgi:hypothetical protein
MVIKNIFNLYHIIQVDQVQVGHGVVVAVAIHLMEETVIGVVLIITIATVLNNNKNKTEKDNLLLYLPV